MNATRFDRDDIIILNIQAPAKYDDAEYGGETWANQVCSGAPEYNAPDYNGTTGGDRRGINVLIRRGDLEWWEDSAKGLGCETEIEWQVEDGHYGDGNYEGVDIVSVPGSDSEVYWIER